MRKNPKKFINDILSNKKAGPFVFMRHQGWFVVVSVPHHCSAYAVVAPGNAKAPGKVQAEPSLPGSLHRERWT